MNKYASDHFAKAFYDQHYYAKDVLPLRYREGMTPEERKQWQKALKEKITELMAFPDTMYDMPVVNLLKSKQRFGYRVEKYEISPEPNLWATFLMLIPDKASEENKTPGVLCLPGGRWTKEALCGEDFCDLEYDPPQPVGGIAHRYYYANMQAVHYAQAGMTAIACEDIGVGEHKGAFEPGDLEKLLIGQGRSMMGVTVELRMAMIKWLKTRPFVDIERIAISGHSLGVDSAMLAVTLDEDIKAFVYNDYVCDWQAEISAMCPPEKLPCISWHMYPGMYRWYTYPDILAAFAPRKLFITEGGKTEYLEMVAKSYAECGAAENFRYDYYREYQDLANRKYEDEPLPRGCTQEEMFERCNVVPEKHFFKFEQAVPWLVEALK